MSKIFLLEDNESLGKSLEERLNQEGYSVTWASSLAAANKTFGDNHYALAIVDVSLPDGSGFEFARSTLKNAKTPVIFLSAFSSAEYRLEGFDAGAADYIPKPFHLRELLMRVKKVLETSKSEHVMRVGGAVINLESMAVTTEDGKSNFLAPRDFTLFQLLVKSSPRVVSRGEIIKEVWGDDSSGNERTVDNAIVRLRQNLGVDAGKHIRSVRGVGYQWVQEEG